MLSGGEQESLENLSRKVLLELCSFDVLRSTLAVFPEDATQVPEDIFLDVLKLTLRNLSKENNVSHNNDIYSGKFFNIGN